MHAKKVRLVSNQSVSFRKYVSVLNALQIEENPVVAIFFGVLICRFCLFLPAIDHVFGFMM